MFQTKWVLKNQGCMCLPFFRHIRNQVWASKLFAVIISEDNQIHCSLLIGTSTVTPTKYVPIQRLGLTVVTL